jgi:DNA (cytosine-5)-methyltransferase 1
VKVGADLRRLTPVELERLNGFPDNWTQGHSDNKRAFLMGNALVVGMVARIAQVLESEFSGGTVARPERQDMLEDFFRPVRLP